MRKKSSRGVAFEASSGNVFADLELPNADELLVKADLMHAVNREIQRRNLIQSEVAKLVGLSQSDISNIARGKGERYSQERLLDVLRHLGVDVEIRVHRRRTGGVGTLRVREVA